MNQKNKYQLFQNEDFNTAISEKGYVVFKLEDQRIPEDLLNLFNDIKIEHEFNGFHASMYHDDLDYRNSSDVGIRQILSEELKDLFTDEYLSLYANFMVKEPSENSVMKLHQDWAYVDEGQSDSFAIWIPLIDLNEDNGALHVFPYSHLVQNYVRGPGLNCPFIGQWKTIEREFLKPVYLKKGEAIVWQHRLAHCSPPNLSNFLRIAATAIIVPKNQSIIHYYKSDNSDHVNVYDVDRHFFMHYKIASTPKAPLRKTMDYDFVSLKNSDLYNLVPGRKEKGIFSKIKNLISK